MFILTCWLSVFISTSAGKPEAAFAGSKKYAIKTEKGVKTAPKDTIHVVGHAHMDMNWLWTYTETMKMCNDNLRQTVAFMEEFPDYPAVKFTTAGDWKNGVWAEGDDFNVPIYASEPLSLSLVSEHSTRPEEDSFISVKQSNIILSGIKQSEEGNELVIRLVEVEGKETTLNLTLPVAIESARRLNLIELPLKDAAPPQIKGKTVKVIVKPHEIVTLGIQVSH